jgi:NADH-quinone oxidoreductase subunit C
MTDDFGIRVAEAVGGIIEPAVDTVKVSVTSDRWVEALTSARDELGLIYFSWLSGIDWTNEVAVGDPPSEPVDERYEILCTVGDLVEGRRATFSTTLDKDDAVIDTLVGVYAGANWHERECHEMFGIDFRGHPDLDKLYLPDAFIGNPLRKSYRLLSREVKPWPGKVDVEGMPGADDDDEPVEDGEAAGTAASSPDGPSTTNPEA